jgi:branched-chain amino acid transport system substrate-binding protein
MDKYIPTGTLSDGNYLVGMALAYTMVDVLNRCGKDVTRANVMKMADSLNEVNPFVYPGITVSTSATNHFPMTSAALVRYDNGRFIPTGALIDARSIIKAEK